MKLTLDRIEGNIAVFVDDGGETCQLPASALPDGAAEGDVFRLSGSLYDGAPVLEPDHAETAEREERISALFNKLKRKKG